MRNGILLIFLFLLSAASIAQITITQADYGQAGDSIVVGYDDSPPTGINVGGSGMQNWDFTSFSLSNINTLNFVDPATTSSGSSFANADLAIERQDDTLFFQSGNTAFVIDGFAGQGFGLPVSIVANFNPNSTQIEFPSSTGSSFVDTAVFDTIVGCAEFGFGSTCDSARIKRVLIGTSNINAYGNVSTPGGEFETVRQYFREDNRDTVWVKLPFVGWTQFLDSASTVHNYRWLANGEKWPVVNAIADAAGGDIISTEYVVGAQVLGYADSEINPYCTGECSGSASVSAVGGVPPYSYAWPGGQTTSSANGLCAGTYLVTITDNDTGTYVVTVELEDPDPITISGAVQGVSVGGDGAIDISVSGGVGAYSYSWTGPNGFSATTQDIGDLETGDYTVVVSDVNNCDTSRSFTVDLTGIQGPVSGGFKLYPNPADAQVTMVSTNAIESYRVADLLGNEVLRGGANSNKEELSTSSLSAGIYIIEVRTSTSVFLHKFTVRH